MQMFWLNSIANSTTTWQTNILSSVMFSRGGIYAINLLKYYVWFCVCVSHCFEVVHKCLLLSSGIGIWLLMDWWIVPSFKAFGSLKIALLSSSFLHFSRNGNWAWKRIFHCQRRPRMPRPTSLMKAMVLWQHGKFLFWLLLWFLTTKLLKMFVVCGWVL